MSAGDIIYDCLHRMGAEDIRATSEGFESRCPVCDSRKRSFRVAYVSKKSNRAGAFFCQKCHVSGYLEELVIRAYRVPREEAIAIAKNSGDYIIRKAPKKEKPDPPGPEDFLPFRKTLSSYLVDERAYEADDVWLYRIGMDAFTDELVIPNHSVTGDIVGITRRIAAPGEPYIHSQFEKSEHVWGLDAAINRGIDHLYITEGQLDPLGLIPRVRGMAVPVALNGSWMSEEQARLIVQVARPSVVILALDNDMAGYKGTHRAIDLLREAGQPKIACLIYPGSDPGKLPFEDGECTVVSTRRWKRHTRRYYTPPQEKRKRVWF